MQTQTVKQSPFRGGSGLMGATETGQRVTSKNAHWLPPGSVVRLDGDADAVLIHLHDDIWYWRSGCAWCYDHLERFLNYLPGTLCHYPT